MFNRSAIGSLRKWAEKKEHKPLILRGARQVGKTTLVRRFGEEFDVFIELNLEDSGDAALFRGSPSFDDLLLGIYAKAGVRRSDRRTLIFIDEIQAVPEAVQSLRFFYERGGGNVYVIAAGSLLESLIGNHISFPVGRV